jgi:hypothetical protein
LNRTNGLKLFYRIHHWKNWVQLIRDEAIKRCLARLLLRSWAVLEEPQLGFSRTTLTPLHFLLKNYFFRKVFGKPSLEKLELKPERNPAKQAIKIKHGENVGRCE